MGFFYVLIMQMSNVFLFFEISVLLGGAFLKTSNPLKPVKVYRHGQSRIYIQRLICPNTILIGKQRRDPRQDEQSGSSNPLRVYHINKSLSNHCPKSFYGTESL
jgi:hypothetical protein